MLTQCFDHLFAQLSQGRVSMDSVLQLWLTINQNSSTSSPEDNTPQTFNPARTPVVPLGSLAVVHLFDAVLASPVVPVRTWVYVLHTLCLLTNQKMEMTSLEELAEMGAREALAAVENISGVNMVPVVLNNPNLIPFILKFLSGSSANSPSSSGLQFYQVGWFFGFDPHG